MSIRAKQSLKGSVSSKSKLIGLTCSKSKLVGHVNVGDYWIADELPLYDGEYSVTPSANNEQTLLTAQKRMNANVTIEKIPYAEVSNNSGGTTVTIGEE